MDTAYPLSHSNLDGSVSVDSESRPLQDRSVDNQPDEDDEGTSNRTRDFLFSCRCSVCKGGERFKLETLTDHYIRDKYRAIKKGKYTILEDIPDETRRAIDVSAMPAHDLYELTSAAVDQQRIIAQYRAHPYEHGEYVGINRRPDVGNNGPGAQNRQEGVDTSSSDDNDDDVFSDVASDNDALSDNADDDDASHTTSRTVEPRLSSWTDLMPPMLLKYLEDERLLVVDSEDSAVLSSTHSYNYSHSYNLCNHHFSHSWKAPPRGTAPQGAQERGDGVREGVIEGLYRRPVQGDDGERVLSRWSVSYHTDAAIQALHDGVLVRSRTRLRRTGERVRSRWVWRESNHTVDADPSRLNV